MPSNSLCLPQASVTIVADDKKGTVNIIEIDDEMDTSRNLYIKVRGPPSEILFCLMELPNTKGMMRDTSGRAFLVQNASLYPNSILTEVAGSHG